MLAIRLQRLGRKAYPTYRLAVQESQRHPQSGRVVAYVGNYNPHTKEINLDEEAIQKFLDHGAQPSDRVVKLLKEVKNIKLPKWVRLARSEQKKAIRYPEKLRRNQPAEPVDTTEAGETPAATPSAETDSEA